MISSGTVNQTIYSSKLRDDRFSRAFQTVFLERITLNDDSFPRAGSFGKQGCCLFSVACEDSNVRPAAKKCLGYYSTQHSGAARNNHRASGEVIQPGKFREIHVRLARCTTNFSLSLTF